MCLFLYFFKANHYYICGKRRINNMKKAANILLIISGVFCILSILGAIAGTVVCFVVSGNTDLIKQGLSEGWINIPQHYQGSEEQAVQFVKLALITVGVLCIVYTAIYIAGAAISFQGAKKETKGLYIVNIVVGVIGGSIFNLIGGILGLVGASDNR